MPSATPLPRGPARLVLFGAADLLSVAGCPVCRYTADDTDRFYGWFALEGHADTGMTTRLCASLGLCPVHTRGIAGQPGAGQRLTAVYRYLLQAAVRYLSDGSSPPDSCLGCTREAEAGQRALDTLLAGLDEEDLWDRYADAGGLCLPHLRGAAATGGRRRRPGRRRVAALADIMGSRLAEDPSCAAVVAGDMAADSVLRIRLRAQLPALPAASARDLPGQDGQEGYLGPGDLPGQAGQEGYLGPDACPACLAGALAEREALAEVTAMAASSGRAPAGSSPGLCRAHLQEICSQAAEMPTSGSCARLLEWQARRSLAEVRRLAERPGLRDAFSLRGHRLVDAPSPAGTRRRPGTEPEAGHDAGAAGCPACAPRRAAVRSAMTQMRLATALPPGRHSSDLPPGGRSSAPAPGTHSPAPRLCLRHVMEWRAEDPRSAASAVRMAITSAQSLIAELEDAFRKRTWEGRHDVRGPEMTAWRRAAALVDGRVYGGGPPGPL